MDVIKYFDTSIKTKLITNDYNDYAMCQILLNSWVIFSNQVIISIQVDSELCD